MIRAMPEKRPGNELGRYLAMAQVGLEMVVPIVIGTVVDERLGWAPWGVTVGAVVGLGGGLYHLVHLANAADQAEEPRRGERDAR
jgi:F0F1-type ATP synthase assembly protein I